MSKVFFTSVLSLLIFFTLASTIEAAVTFGFGGKVISTEVAGVTCKKQGTGPFMVSSSSEGLADSASTIAGNGSTGQKIVSGVSAIYGLIPFFATDLKKKPKKGGSILGKAEAAPNFKICSISKTTKGKDGKPSKVKVPFPVRLTKEYNISGGN